MVRFDHVWLSYRGGGGILRDISFEVPAGGFRWLIGASGAGKTSMLRLMYLAERPSRGQVRLLGGDPAGMNRREAALLRRRIGVVYQDFRLLAHLSVHDNVALPMRLARRSEAQVTADVTELVSWVGLAAKLHCRPDELSGGEQQRVAIARAIVGRPKLLLADEPTGNLDDAQAERLMHLITSLNQLGATIIIATHNLALVGRYPAPALRLEDGVLIDG